ncbi:addiction module protein [Nannocystaceae bacterium ST9]
MNERTTGVRKSDLIAELLELSREDRLDVLHELFDSLEGRVEVEPDVEAKWMVEVRRRHAEVLAGTAKLTDWEDVRARLLGG